MPVSVSLLLINLNPSTFMKLGMNTIPGKALPIFELSNLLSLITPTWKP
jgi:hypothetical protein